MKRWLWVLSGALLLQIVLLVQQHWELGLWRQAGDTPSIMAINPDRLDEIYITGDNGQEVVLLHSGSHWILPELNDLPANADKIHLLLQSIGDTGKAWPVADTVAARQRFKVASYHFNRKLVLIGRGELLGTLYLGTSPGFRQVHVRNETQDAIYAINFNAFDAPADSSAWLDRKLLRVRTAMRIDADGYSLHRQGKTWQSDMGDIADMQQVKTLVATLENLEIDALASAAQQQQLAAAEAELILHIDSLAGPVTLSVYTLGERQFIHSSEYQNYFSLSRYQFDLLTGIDITKVSASL